MSMGRLALSMVSLVIVIVCLSGSNAYAILNPTNMTITADSAVVHAGKSVQFYVKVNDMSTYPTTPSGTIAFSDNGVGGIFSPITCVLSYGNCTTTYSSSNAPHSSIRIFGGYSGDSAHVSSSSNTEISTNLYDPTILTVSSSSQSFKIGSPLTVSSIITDTANVFDNVNGFIYFSDNHVGGIFSPTKCILNYDKCSVTYFPPSNSTSGIRVTGTYNGDATHLASSGESLLQIISSPIPQNQIVNATGMSACFNQGGSWNAGTQICSTTAVVTSTPINTPSTTPSVPVVKQTSAGSLNISFITNPSSPNTKNQTTLGFTFLNKNDNSLQTHVDYRVYVKQGNDQVFGIPSTHTALGVVNIPIQFQTAGSYDVTVEVQGITFQPIPTETAVFTVFVNPPVIVNSADVEKACVDAGDNWDTVTHVCSVPQQTQQVQQNQSQYQGNSNYIPNSDNPNAGASSPSMDASPVKQEQPNFFTMLGNLFASLFGKH